MKVSEIMSKTVVSVDQNEPVTAAARLLKQCNVGALPVCDEKRQLRGILTDRDIVTRCVAMGADPAALRVGEIMSRGILTAGPEDSVERASKLMGSDQVRRLPVVNDGELVGVLSLCDLARDAACDMEAGEALTEISANCKRK